MHKLHNWHIGLVFPGVFILQLLAPNALPDASYTTLIAAIIFIAVVHNVFALLNGERHESLVVVRNVCSRFTGK